MGKKDKETIRFAFGTAARPGSSVWRLIKSKGDVYLHNAPQFGTSVHIALHASGIFSLKLGSVRQRLSPPFKDPHGLYWGPVIFFRNWERSIPPISPSGKIDKIHWLGWPADENLFVVKFIYSERGTDIVPCADEFKVGDPLQVKLFHSDMSLQIFVQERTMSDDEKKVSSTSPYSPLQFNGHAPAAIELLRVALKTDLGPSAILYEGFQVE